MATTPDQPWVIFTVAEARCALAAESVSEVVPIATFSRPPGRPDIVEGFLNLRGQPLPVLRLERLFNLPVSPLTAGQHVMVVRSRKEPLAIVVDYVSDIRALKVHGIALFPTQRVFNDCTVSEVTLDGAPLYLLSADQLLMDEERERIRQLQAMEQSRLHALENEAA